MCGKMKRFSRNNNYNYSKSKGKNEEERDDFDWRRMKMLGKKLKIKSNEDMMKSLSVDGLDDLFMGITAGSRFAKKDDEEDAKKRRKYEPEDDEDDEEEEEEEQDEDDDNDSDDDDGDDDDDDDDDESIIDDDKNEKEKEETKTQETKLLYIAPHKRFAVENVMHNNRELQFLRVQIRGLLNKASESNINRICNELEKLYTTFTRGDIHEVLAMVILDTIKNMKQMPVQFAAVLVSLIYYIHLSKGNENSSYFVEYYCHQLNQSLSSKSLEKEAVNVSVVFVELYNFGLFASKLILDFVTFVLNIDIKHTKISSGSNDNYDDEDHDNSSNNVYDVVDDILLVIFKNCGVKLQKEDPAALKDVIFAIQQKKKDVKSRDSHHAFVLDSILEMLGNKTSGKSKSNNNNNISSINGKRKEDDCFEIIQRLKKVVRSHVVATSKISDSSIPLHVSWDDLMNIEEKGRFWLTGAAFVGNQHQQLPPLAKAKKVKRSKGKESDDENSNGNDEDNENSTKKLVLQSSNDNDDIDIDDKKILEAAKRTNMNSELKKTIFATLMSSDDYLDAFARLMKLNLHDKQDREIVHVLLHCSKQEKVFNPFYAHLAAKLITYNHNFRFTFQLSFYDIFKSLNDFQPRHIFNLAQLLAFLIADSSLSLTILKSAPLSDSLDTSVVLFFTTFFKHLLFSYSKQQITSAFSKIVNPDTKPLCKSISTFITKYVRSSSLPQTQSAMIDTVMRYL